MIRHVSLVAIVLGSVSARAAVPTTIGFTARIVDDKSGDLVTGSHHFTFQLFDATSGGQAVWTEARDLELVDGLLFVDLGELAALDRTVFDGRKLFLEVGYDSVVMQPRVALGSVPYAVRADTASDADAIGGLSAQDLQRRVSGTCATGNYIAGVNPDGTVSCAPDLSGAGSISGVVAGIGLAGGGTSGTVTVGLQSCAANEILKSNGSTWSCAADANAGGDITSVSVGPAGGLTGGGTGGDLLLSLLTTCSPGQLLKWSGSSWACANDTDTNSGGTITAVTASGTSGLVGGGSAGAVALSLLTSCSPGQLLKWNGSAWGCANDIDTDTNSGGDITDVVAGNGLTGGGSSGPLQLDIGAGVGITVVADSVQLDTAFTDSRYDARYDPRYVNVTGDTMTGTLNMNQQRVTNRGCPSGYVRIGPGMCTEFTDQNGFTFAGCANRCRVAGTHMCSSAEMRAIMLSGVVLDVGGNLLDWVDDQDAVGAALFVNSTANADTMDASRPTTSSSFCRCCSDVE